MAPLAERIPVPTALIAVATCCLFFTTAAVGARAFVKALHWRQIHVDDVFIFFAKVGCVAFAAISFDSVIAGQGNPASQLSPESLQRVRLFSNILSILYVPTILASKIAILVQIARFFSSIRRRALHWSTWALLAASTIGYMAVLLLRILACTPRVKLLNSSIRGKCIGKSVDSIVAGAVSIMSNIAIFVLMAYVSTEVQFTRTKKIYVTLILGLGVFACACSALELVQDLSEARTDDFSKTVLSVNLWALAEMASLLVIACSPSLPRLLDVIVRKTSEPEPALHDKWISTASSRSTTPGSKVDTLGRVTPATPHRSPTPTPRPVSTPSYPPLATTTIDPSNPVRPFSIFESVEHRISHISHSTWHSAASFPPSREASQSLPSSPITTISSISPSSPVSPTRTEHSVEEMRAWEMSVVPVTLGNITKTIHVRVSAHTNPGSPVKWGAPDPQW